MKATIAGDIKFKNRMEKKRFTTTKKLLWFLNIVNTFIYISYAVALVYRNVDLATIVAASTTITTGFNGGYMYKSYSENKQRYGVGGTYDDATDYNDFV